MSTLTLIGLLLLGAPWIVTLAVVAFAVVVWWTQPRQRTPVRIVAPPPAVKECPVPNKCLDCQRIQGPALTTCWLCSGGKSRLRPVDPSEAEMYV